MVVPRSTSSATDYNARHLQVLEGLEAVRKRPGMYIGSTDSRGLMHCLWEIIDNAVDEALGGFGSSILIELEPDGSVAVTDHGRGIPVDIEPRTGLTGVEVVYDTFDSNEVLETKMLQGGIGYDVVTPDLLCQCQRRLRHGCPPRSGSVLPVTFQYAGCYYP